MGAESELFAHDFMQSQHCKKIIWEIEDCGEPKMFSKSQMIFSIQS